MHRLAIVIFLCFFSTHEVSAIDTLEVGLLVVNVEQRNAYYELAQKFEEENPQLKINYVVRRGNDYHLLIEKWLADDRGVDVLFWQAGERLFRYARQGWLEPLNELWKKEQWDDSFSSGVKETVSLQGNTYGVPFSYYQWGFYYKESLFAKLKIQPPKTWEEFLIVCQILKSKGVYPIAIGTKEFWPAAAWFDYFNLRLNGLAFHQKLMTGKASYTDARVRKVFEIWKTLIDKEYFLKSHEKLSWRNSLSYLYNDRAGMVLSGNFVSNILPQLLIQDIKFFRFPKIKSNIPWFEEAPLNIFMIPKNSKFKRGALKFLAFMGRADTQTFINEKFGYIAPNLNVKPNKNDFSKIGPEMLNNVAGISQYYDRDTPKEMSEAGVILFAEFITSGDIDTTVEELERIRKNTFASH